MINKFEEIYNSLKGENYIEKLKDLEDRMWQYELIDKWTRKQVDTYDTYMNIREYLLQKIKEENNGK